MKLVLLINFVLFFVGRNMSCIFLLFVGHEELLES